MCSERKDYKTLYEETLKTIDLLEFRIEQMHLKDSCYSILDSVLDKPKERIYLIESPRLINCQFHTCKMVTLTFDPRKFPVLINRTAQRDYIRYVLDLFIDLFGNEINSIYGCYELHDSGIVHSHFMIDSLDEHQYKFLQKYFTNDKNNDKAVHRCEKYQQQAVDYINKKETKDNNNMQNYYGYTRRTVHNQFIVDKLPTQEQLYEKFKNINNYII